MSTSSGTRREVPLRRRLLAIALAGIVPLAGIAGVGLWQLVEHEEDQVQLRTLDVTRLAATALETEVGRSLDVLEALSLSPLLLQDDLDDFSRLVQRVLPLVPNWHSLLIVDPQGKVIRRVSTTAIQPDGAIADWDSFNSVLSTGIRQAGSISKGPRGTWGIPLRVPVMRDGKIHYVLTGVLKPSGVLAVLNTRALPEGSVMTVLDRSGNRIARTRRHEETLGEPASSTLVEMLRERPEPEGTGRSVTVEGVPSYTSFVRLQSEAGWIVATGMPTSVVENSAARAFSLYGGGLTLSLLLAIVAALIASRRISEPMDQLRQAAVAIGAGEMPTAPSTDIEEISDVGRALEASGRARLESEAERGRTMIRLKEAQQALTRQVTGLERLHGLSNRLIELPDLSSQLAAIIDLLCDLQNTRHALILSRQLKGRPLVVASHGFTQENLAKLNASSSLQGELGVQLLEGGEIIASETPCALDGFHSLHSTPFKSSDGSVSGAIVLLHTEPQKQGALDRHLADLCAGLAAVLIDRARMQARAGESQRTLQVALESSSVPFCVLAPERDEGGAVQDFRWEFINPRGARVLQRSVEELIGAPLGEVLTGWQNRQTFAELLRVVDHGESRDVELSAAADRAERWVHIIATPFEGRVAVWFADITERKKQEALMRQADRRKDEFLATLAHELRNPLAPIRMAASLFGSQRATDSQKQRSQQIIERQVAHMALLLDDLFDISRITLGKLALRVRPVDLRDVARAALETSRPKLELRRHDVALDVPNQPIPVEADPMRLEQVITNLLTNAAKFTPEGGRVALRVYTDQQHAFVSVSDNGLGLAAEQIPAIFEKFAQVATQGGVSAGLGIGLALARELARLHGGEVEAHSEGLQRGSEFVVRLPCGAALEVSRQPDRPEATTALRPRRVLVADDNPDIAATVADILRLEGHEVIMAHDGSAALAAYEEHIPDAAVLDIGMPGMRGDDVARAIRARDDGGLPLLIAMTGWGQPADKQNALNAGFDKHLTKPVDARTLLELLRSGPRLNQADGQASPS
ncbi:response regulator [Halopseudomonas nanhaiensis]|uniref:hybrid sensor histidine kinase/response regulator n=1 Tax=Halopseudomonas nanhaiensis TaxID=2830842 RepID=UPI001CBCBB59|nr:ATP-binding protein [Halopseudomonas nanhaiensis]UAW97414.1 response regulator [Halopseudomonas nanhaiensis]